jgi:putative GTP pyrophosphokinase
MMDHEGFCRYLDEKAPELMRLGNAIRSYVENQLRIDGFPELLKIPADPRPKSHSSAIAKIIKKNYNDPVSQMTDMVGLRFVVLLHEDVERISAIIESGPWSASLDRAYEQEKLENPTTFTYQSNHFVVYTKENDFSREIGVSPKTPCEVQVRTLLQHAYGELTHDTIYKPGDCPPTPVAERLVARSMALIESTDSLFMETVGELRQSVAPINEWFDGANGLFHELIGDAGEPNVAINIEFRIVYEGVESVTSIEKLQEFWRGEQGRAFVPRVKERLSTSFLFRQPMVLALYYALRQDQRTVTKRWPFESLNTDLDAVYSDLGIARTHTA